MIISHRKKFIFIHNYKVAGTSIGNSLREYDNRSFRSSAHIDKLMLLAGIYPRIYSSQFDGHVKAFQLKNRIAAKIFDSYFKFGFVRDPWDWQVSLYSYMLKLETHHQHKLVKSMKGFDEYIDWRVHNDLHLQKSFFYEEDVCLMDFIGKLENLKDDFRSVCERLKIDAELSRLNASRENQSYLTYYSKHSVTMVAQAFEEDIKLFGYSRPAI
jgi:hypothetical protein